MDFITDDYFLSQLHKIDSCDGCQPIWDALKLHTSIQGNGILTLFPMHTIFKIIYL